jgi:hypothetical protein
MTDASGTATPFATAPLPPDVQWQPVVGEHATALMDRQSKLSSAARTSTVQTAASIMSRGQNPTGPDGSRTGLVVGYVQSGKTLSFTTIVAMARDNDIPVVIVIAGSSKGLFDQTDDRLAGDLQITPDDIPPSWLHISNPDDSKEAVVRKRIKDWKDTARSKAEKPTLLLTVMKHHQRLQNLDTLLSKLDLEGVPAIIIDDEADQASLNTLINRGQESPTYQKILSIKGRLPKHTFLQYTATPQAPLLINIIDALSPDFVEVLEPGLGYVGGLHFFGDDQRFTEVIPAADVPSRNNQIVGAPSSLLEALAFFFVSVSVGLIDGQSKNNPNRSMLVHPSRTTDAHLNYFQSIERVRDDWLALLQGPTSEPDREDLIADFKTAYDDLATTADNMPPFDDVVAGLPRALDETLVREVNRRGGRAAERIEWNQAYAWILVGGQAMDRGFTVRELSVTYMPRGAGIGNADTLQQRARFFGYKQGYLGHCRLYLENDVLDAFKAYVIHEEQMRAELLRLQESGEPLASWKRRFFLDSDLKPCRNNVIEHGYGRGNFSDDWFYPRMARMSQEAIDDNTEIVAAFLGDLDLKPDETYKSDQPAQQHLVADGVSLSDIRSKLLVDYKVQGARDTSNLIGLIFQLERAIAADPNETARVYKMRPKYPSDRSIDGQGQLTGIRRIQQGPTRAGGGGYSYPGDWAFKDDDRICVQLHSFDLTDGRRGPVVRESVPILTVWVPRRLEADWLTQDQTDGGLA